MSNILAEERLQEVKSKRFSLLELSLIAAVATIPWYNNVNSWGLILFCIVGLFSNNLKEKKRLLSRNYYWVFSVAYYVIAFASLLWDKNGWAAVKSMEKHTSFLIIPLVMASVPAFSATAIKRALLAFVASVFVICVLCLWFSYRDYGVTGDDRVFFYHYLSGHMELNAVYLSLFVIFSMLVLLFYAYIDPLGNVYKVKVPVIILCIFFTLMIMLLSAKMAIFLYMLLLLTTVLYIFFIRKKLLLGIVLSLVIVASSTYILWQLPYIKWRLEVTLFKKYGGTDDDQNGLAVRQIIWQSALELIAEKPVLGYGLEGGSELLVEQHKKNNFTLGYERKYNCHNAYLQALLNTGIVGLSALLLIIGGAFMKAIRSRNFLFVSFTFLVTVQCITESLLEVQKGVVFFMFVIFLFYYHSPKLFRRRKETNN